MRWPWQRIERRETQPFTDAIVSAIAAGAGGTSTGDPAGISALEAAAGLYAAAFAGAALTPSNAVTDALTPAVRALMARNLIRRGESVHLIDLHNGRPMLRPVGSWDVRGGFMPSDWYIRCDLFGPSGNVTRFVPHSAVVHARYAVDPARPWFGRGPLAWARHTGALAGNLELRLSEEAGGPSGYVVPVPEPETPEGEGDDPNTDPLTMIAAGIAGLKGKTKLVPTTSAGFSGDTADRPTRDWKAERIGMNPPEVLAGLRTAAGQAVLSACQVPMALFSDADGTSQRESWRRWAMGPLAGLAATVEAELAEKLDVAVRFDFSHLWAQDVAGRASAFKALIAGGMDITTAAGASVS